MPNEREGRGSKFVQITATARSGDEGSSVYLFALDNLGQTWEYEFGLEVWQRLSNDRQAEPDV